MTLVKVGRQILNNFMASHKGAGKEMTGPLREDTHKKKWHGPLNH